jgi:hypothetical protein
VWMLLKEAIRTNRSRCLVAKSPPLETLVKIARKLKNARHIEKIEDLEKLPGEYQEILVSVLDSFIKRHRFEELAQS